MSLNGFGVFLRSDRHSCQKETQIQVDGILRPPSCLDSTLMLLLSLPQSFKSLHHDYPVPPVSTTLSFHLSMWLKNEVRHVKTDKWEL